MVWETAVFQQISLGLASGVWLGLETCHSGQRKTALEQGATHEMGHYFEARVNDILGVNSVRNTLGKYANEDLPLNIRIPRRGGDNDEVKYGFADTTYIWQFSDLATTGEEYADMFLGWNYNQWEMRDDNSGFTDLGQARSSFMERYMAPWIALVINRERK